MAGNLAINNHLAFRADAAGPPFDAVDPISPFTNQATEAQSQPKPTRHLKYLEGLRGLAAIVVTLQHIYFHTLWGTNLTGWQANLVIALGWLFPGRAAVAVFIVLSGYLLMRPVVREGTGKIPGGTWSYIRRRAKRILPILRLARILHRPDSSHPAPPRPGQSRMGRCRPRIRRQKPRTGRNRSHRPPPARTQPLLEMGI